MYFLFPYNVNYDIILSEDSQTVEKLISLTTVFLYPIWYNRSKEKSGKNDKETSKQREKIIDGISR